MFDVEALKTSFGKAAGVYDEHAELQRQVRAYTLKIALSYWPEQGKVLDIGCGTAALAKELKYYRNKLHVYGLDISFGMCSQSLARLSRIANANAATLPFGEDAFDAIFSSLMLQWADEPKDVLAEMARVLKPGGYAVISTLAEGTLHELQQAFSVVDPLPHVSDFKQPHAILQAAGKAGLSLVIANQNKIVQYYPDAIALMRRLQSIGASNKHKKRAKGLMTSAKFARLEAAYSKTFSSSKGLPATWQVLTLVLQKEER